MLTISKDTAFVGDVEGFNTVTDNSGIFSTPVDCLDVKRDSMPPGLVFALPHEGRLCRVGLHRIC